jgi:TonB family protein
MDFKYLIPKWVTVCCVLLISYPGFTQVQQRFTGIVVAKSYTVDSCYLDISMTSGVRAGQTVRIFLFNRFKSLYEYTAQNKAFSFENIQLKSKEYSGNIYQLDEVEERLHFLLSLDIVPLGVAKSDSKDNSSQLSVQATDDEIKEVDLAEEDAFNFINVESKPIFPGCEGLTTEDERFNCFNVKIRQFVGEEFEFPEKAKEMGIQGKIWVSFIIEKDGTVSNIIIERGVDKLLDEEAIRVMRKLPKFIPARIGGKIVRMQYSLPINARLK